MIPIPARVVDAVVARKERRDGDVGASDSTLENRNVASVARISSVMFEVILDSSLWSKEVE